MEQTLGPKTLKDVGYDTRMPLSSLSVGVTRKDAEYAYRKVLKPLNAALAKIVDDMNRNELMAYGGTWPDGAAPKWQFIEGGDTFSQLRGWCAKPSWFVRWTHAKHKQGMAPIEKVDATKPASLSATETTGTAHPNIYGHNFLNWQIRCVLEKNGLIPEGKTGEGGVPNQVCTWKSKPPILTARE